MAVEGLEYLKRELEKIADEATTDCYNEYEQIAGWCAYLEATNLDDIIREIWGCYIDKKLKLREAYNSYKHGFRLLFSKDMHNDIDTVVFIKKGGSKDFVTVDEESVKVYMDLKNKCVLLFKIMLHNHRTRQELIKENILSKRATLLFLEKANNVLSKSVDVMIKYDKGGRITYLSHVTFERTKKIIGEG